jgi:hypothetical protein
MAIADAAIADCGFEFLIGTHYPKTFELSAYGDFQPIA